MDYLSLLKGPYMIGLLFIIIGILQKYLPPKNINSWYGYRSASSRVSQQTWDAANNYSSTFMIKAGIVVLLLGYIIYMLTHLLTGDNDIRQMVSYFILFGGALGIGAFTAAATERHLRRTFKPKKKRK